MRKCKKPSVVHCPTFPPSSEDYYYSMLLLLIPHRLEDELIHPYVSAKDAFIHKRITMNSYIHFTYFLFTEQIENTMRKIRVADGQSIFESNTKQNW